MNNGDVLVFTYLGYLSQQVTVSDQPVIKVVMKPTANTLTEVVVTALGVKKSEASLSYDQQTVSGKQVFISFQDGFQRCAH